MAKVRKPLLVPVDLKRGGFFHDTDYMRGAGSREEAAQIDAELVAKHGDARWGVSYVMEPYEPFEARLRVVESMRGKSAAYFHVIDEEGRRYPVLMTDFTEMIMHATMIDGVMALARYQAVKRGMAYGIRLADGVDTSSAS